MVFEDITIIEILLLYISITTLMVLLVYSLMHTFIVVTIVSAILLIKLFFVALLSIVGKVELSLKND